MTKRARPEDDEDEDEARKEEFRQAETIIQEL